MEIEASIDESDIGFIQAGQAVKFTVDAYGQEEFTGKVEEVRLQPQVISNVVIYTVIISTVNGNQQLMPGMTANLDITTEKVNDALLAPVSALNFKPPAAQQSRWKEYLQNKGVVRQTANSSGGQAGLIWLLEENGIRPQWVWVQLNNGRQAAIESADLRPGEMVVTGQAPQNNRRSDKAQSPFMPSLPGSGK